MISIRKKDSIGIAEGHALGVSIAEITFHSHSFLSIKGGMAERAGEDTGLAPDAKIFVDDHPVIEFRLPVAGFGGAYLNAEGFLAMIADHGKVNSCVLPLDHLNPGSTWIARPGMKH